MSIHRNIIISLLLASALPLPSIAQSRLNMQAAKAKALAVYYATTNITKDKGDLFLMSADGRVRQLTFDGKPKAFPVFSPKGDMIAYDEITDYRVADGKLVVIDLAGKIRAQKLVNAVGPDEYFHINLEAVEWMGPDENRIIFYGHDNNPTSAIGYIERFTDSNRNSLEDDTYMGGFFTDFASSYAISPNGVHVVIATNGSQDADFAHVRPSIVIDNVVFWIRGGDSQIVSPLTWSPDSSRISMMVRDSNMFSATKLITAIVPPLFRCAKPGSPPVPFACEKIGDYPVYSTNSDILNPAVFLLKPIPLPPAIARAATWRVFYNHNDLFVQQGTADNPSGPGTKIVRYPGGNLGQPEAVSFDTVTDPAVEAPALRDSLFHDLLLAGPHLGVSEADIWCGDPGCGPLATEPRRNPEGPSGIYIPDLHMH